MSVDVLHRRLAMRWKRTSRTSHNNLAYSTMWTFKSSVIWAFVARLAVIGLTYAQPFLIMGLTNYVQVFNCLYQHHNFRLITKIRGAIVSSIFEKTLNLKFDEYSDTAALTLMSNDVDNIAFGVQNMHEVWASPIETGIALFLLQRQVAWAAVIPAFVTVIAFVSTHFLSKSTPGRQKS
ncbi:unnamed protein product [Penicillium crustosum]